MPKITWTPKLLARLRRLSDDRTLTLVAAVAILAAEVGHV